MMQISNNCTDLIARFEGFRTNAYLDPIGIPTIGFGTIKYINGNKVKMGDTISRESAMQELYDHVSIECIPGLERVIGVDLNQNQIDAIVCFVYNVGFGAFAKSTMLKMINAGDFDSAGKQFMRWTKAGGRELPGLVKRREAEMNLFLS